MPFHCNFFKSRGKQTAMKIRWAKHRRGEDNGAKLGRQDRGQDRRRKGERLTARQARRLDG